MPGPMSAPNGNSIITLGQRDGNRNIKTGKTDLKKGRLSQRTKAKDEVRRFQQSRAARKAQEEE